MSDNTLITSDGQPRFGYFDQTPTRINVDDFDYRTPLGGRQLPGRKWLDYNQFQYIGLISDELLVGCALADMRYLGLAFVYTFEPATGDLQEFSLKLPLARGMSLTDRPLDGTSELSSGGNRIRMIAEVNPRVVTLDIKLKSGLEVRASFDMDADPTFEPMALCTQTAKHGWVFTQKVAGIRATGYVKGHFGEMDLSEINAYAHYDYSVGYMRRETFWNWACFSGEVAGSAVGLNVSCGVNETSYSENCIWVDGKLIKVGLTNFEYDRARPAEGQWSVKTIDGAVDLTFEPEGVHEEKLNAIVVAGDLKQVFGKFSGTITPPGGDPITIEDQYGFVEDQYAKW